MDGFQILIYIVIAVVYLILKGVNKAGKTDAIVVLFASVHCLYQKGNRQVIFSIF